jgi:hypothetical protein
VLKTFSKVPSKILSGNLSFLNFGPSAVNFLQFEISFFVFGLLNGATTV